MTRHSRLLVGGAAIAVAAALTACSTTPSTGGPSTSAASPAPTSVGTSSPSPSSTTPAGPRVTESNPPGDIPDNQAFVAFTPTGQHVSVKVPEGWARTSTGDVTTFTDKLNQVSFTVTTASKAPSIDTVRATDIPILQQSVPKFAMGSIKSVQRASQSVLLLTYQGDSAPNEVTGKVVRDAFERYVFFHAGQRLDLTLSGPTNADNVDPWKIVSDSVRWTR